MIVVGGGDVGLNATIEWNVIRWLSPEFITGKRASA
ncbi:MAG: hypothetical protein HW416_3625 [Chloroflexi bacterium]|nr:hypothetical protein [Chloroflexota bacterium]